MKGGMTRLIFLPDRKTFILLKSLLPPEELAEAVVRGHWQPPAAYAAAGRRAFHVTQQGQVVVTPDEEGLPVIPPPDLTRRQREVLQPLFMGELQVINKKRTWNGRYLASRIIVRRMAGKSVKLSKKLPLELMITVKN